MITGGAKIAGVMGWPVKHSRSPRLHGFWLREYGIDGAYVPFAVAPENLREALRALPALGLRGVNLTIPHKEAALAVLDRIDDKARLVGAVNTIVVEDKMLVGSNTDIEGFAESVRAAKVALPTKRPAVLLGAGGAARAVLAALKDLGFGTVRIVNRTRARSEALARDLAGLGLEIGLCDWTRRRDALDGAGFLVNTTSLGMTGSPALALDLDPLPRDAVVTDLVYVPLETELLAQARKRGLAAIDGLGMLLHQARPGFKAWFGVDPQITPELRDFVLG